MAEDLPPRGEPRPRPASRNRQGSGAETGYAVIGTLISGMAVWGGAGWLLDRWLDTRAFLPVGIILGMAAAMVGHRTARIGDGADCLQRGVISFANRHAEAAGVAAGMAVRDALALLDATDLAAPRRPDQNHGSAPEGNP